jgi:hypothetical protein
LVVYVVAVEEGVADSNYRGQGAGLCSPCHLGMPNSW